MDKLSQLCCNNRCRCFFVSQKARMYANWTWRYKVQTVLHLKAVINKCVTKVQPPVWSFPQTGKKRSRAMEVGFRAPTPAPHVNHGSRLALYQVHRCRPRPLLLQPRLRPLVKTPWEFRPNHTTNTSKWNSNIYHHTPHALWSGRSWNSVGCGPELCSLHSKQPRGDAADTEGRFV